MPNTVRSIWIRAHRGFYGITCLIASLGMLVSLFNLNSGSLFYLVPLFVISLFYATPLSFKKTSQSQLRSLPFLKIFLVAGVWSFVTVIFPQLQDSNFTFISGEVAFQFTSRFLFLFAITLPFDIRDMEIDAALKIVTFPIALGVKKTVQLALHLIDPEIAAADPTRDAGTQEDAGDVSTDAGVLWQAKEAGLLQNVTTPALQQKLNLTKVVPEEPRKEMSSGIIDAVAFNEVRIREGSFTYSNLQTSSKTSLDKIDIDVKADSLMGPYNASGQMMYLNQPVKVVAKTGKMSDKAATSAQVEITLADGSTALTFSGVFARQPVFELQGEAGLKS